jgi:hypothetical protein
MGKQKRLPGMQPQSVVDIEEKAEEVKELEQRRMEAAEEEQRARQELTDLMKAHKLKSYDLGERHDLGDGEYEVVVKSGEPKAYVRRKKSKEAKLADGAAKKKGGEESKDGDGAESEEAESVA